MNIQPVKPAGLLFFLLLSFSLSAGGGVSGSYSGFGMALGYEVTAPLHRELIGRIRFYTGENADFSKIIFSPAAAKEPEERNG